MARPPFLARLAAGAAVYAAEEARKLPGAVVKLPMTALSSTAQNAMRLQQFITSLAIKGDTALSRWTDQPVEQPEWATFDDDEPTTSNTTPGRFALYSMPPTAATAPVNGSDRSTVAEPAVAERIDYASLTLAQLRARLPDISAPELAELLAYEEVTLARAPFVTMLTNRIATATAT